MQSPEGAARRCAYANQRMTLYLKIDKIFAWRCSLSADTDSADVFVRAENQLPL